MEAVREPDPYEETIAAWRAAGERGDAQAAAQCLASGVEVISPLTARFRFRGRAQVTDMLAAAFEVIGGIRFHTAVGTGDTRALFYRARVGREEIEEAQLLRLDPAGRIQELTLFGRPLPALPRSWPISAPGCCSGRAARGLHGSSPWRPGRWRS